MFEFRNAIDVTVCIIKVIVTGMTQTLMPEQSLSGSLDRSNRCVLLNVLTEGDVIEGHGERFHGLPESGTLMFLVRVCVLDGGFGTGLFGVVYREAT